MNLKPYHYFAVDDRICLINVEKTGAALIEPALVRILDDLAAGRIEAPTDPVRDQLETLDLIAPDEPAELRPSKAVPVPVGSLALFVTQDCNFDCVYCYGDGGGYGSSGTMGRRTAFRAIDWLIDQAAWLKQVHVNFFGGEPLLNFPLIKEVVEYGLAQEKRAEIRFKFGMTTNASLLDEDKLAFIKDRNLGLQISFDGPANIQDAQRPFKTGRGSYRACLPLIRRLLEICPETSCRATLMDGVDPGPVRDGLRQVGFREGFISPASPCLINSDQSARPTPRDFSGLTDLMAVEADQLVDRIKTRRTDEIKGRFGFSLLPGFVGSFLTNRKKIFYCGAGRGMAGVSVNGDIYLCHRFVGLDDYKLGNVFAGPLDRDKFLLSQLRQSPACADCFARFACGGGCKHDNLGRTGDAFRPNEEMCGLIRRMTELAASVAARIDAQDRAWLTENDLLGRRSCLLDL